MLPNNPLIFDWMALIDRRQGRWGSPHATLNARSIWIHADIPTLQTSLIIIFPCGILQKQALCFRSRARVDAQTKLPMNDTDIRLARAIVDMNWKADTRPWHAAIETMLKDILPRRASPRTGFISLFASTTLSLPLAPSQSSVKTAGPNAVRNFAEPSMKACLLA